MSINNSIHLLLAQPSTPSLTELVQPRKVDESKNGEEDQEARATARKFEALLVHTMLKNMRSTGSDNPLINSDQINLYKDMFDQEIANNIATNGTFGIADVIYQQLTERTRNVETDIDVRELTEIDRNNTPAANNSVYANRQQPVRDTNPAPAPQHFIETIGNQAADTAHKLGTTKEAVMAIAALETGWGNWVPKNPDGSSSYNLFGIKADNHWNGLQSIAQTKEYRQGEARVEYAAFRSYPNMQKSIEDFAAFIKQNPRYQEALTHAADGSRFITELQTAGYATDPRYAEKAIAVMKIIESLGR